MAPDSAPNADSVRPTSTAHEHQWTFHRTDSDWYDGDEEDIYKCECGETQRRYIPR
jgi:hypothetical protein